MGAKILICEDNSTREIVKNAIEEGEKIEAVPKSEMMATIGTPVHRKIRFADAIVEDLNKRGSINVPKGCITGEEYEEWLYQDK